MLKILIVDDNENNRMLLQALLDEYAQENAVEWTMDEATNGIEAVALATEKSYDLILMDLMMPIMDGIEATRLIRAHDPKVMIIAVSAVDDTGRQKEILGHGAEDYISKPINADVFHTRLGNYLALIQSRRHAPKRFNPSPANLFSSEIYSRKFLFYIQNDDELAEFWEYYLLNQEERNEALSAAVRTLYALGSVGTKFKLKLQIITEDGDSFIYMTMVGIDQIDPKIIKLIFAKNPDVTDYKMEEQKLSVRIPRVEKAPPAPLKEVSAPVAEKASIASEPAAVQAPAAVYVAKEQQLQVYDYMDEEDLEEIKDYISKLDSLLLLVGGGDIHSYEVEEISQNLGRIGKISSLYPDSYTIGRALSTLSEEIRTHMDEFLAKSAGLGPLCVAFSRDLTSWIRLIFIEGSPSVNYMDDTISSNAHMISSMLTMDENSAETVDLDDIFDF